jgi:hypothetical protein
MGYLCSPLQQRYELCRYKPQRLTMMLTRRSRRAARRCLSCLAEQNSGLGNASPSPSTRPAGTIDTGERYEERAARREPQEM